MKALKKITPKTMGVEKGAPKEATHIYDVYGQAVGVKSGETAYGPWEALTGDFMAVNPDGEQYRAPVCFLPESFHIMTKTALANAGGAVEFACRVYKEPSEVPIGYEYTAESILPQATNDPLTSLMAKAQRYLEAPKEEEKPKPGKKSAA